MECNYCKKILKTSYSLKTHQKTAKYCLKLRGEKQKCAYSCKACQKTFIKKDHLQRHMAGCDLNNPYIKELEDKVKTLEGQVNILEQAKLEWLEEKRELNNKYEDLAQTLAKQPRFTQNNKINVTNNLGIWTHTDDSISRIVQENYNKDHLIDGQRGAARFANENIIKPLPGQLPIYIATDKSRGHGKYRTSEHEVTTDNHMVGLSEKLYHPIRIKATDIYRDNFDDESVQEGWNDFYVMDKDNSEFRKEMVRLSTTTLSGELSIELLEICSDDSDNIIIEPDRPT